MSFLVRNSPHCQLLPAVIIWKPLKVTVVKTNMPTDNVQSMPALR